MLTVSCYRLVKWHKPGWDNRYVSSIRHMNQEHVLSREYICFYVCVNHDDIMHVIRSCWRIQISIQETIVSSYDLVSMLIWIIVSIKNPVFKYNSIFLLYLPYLCSNEMMSCPWFGLVGGYTSVNERCLSRVTIQPPHRYKLLCAWRIGCV
jgi:hypothetical protein